METDSIEGDKPILLCPLCQNDDFIYEEHNLDGNLVVWNSTCNNCGAMFTEYFKLFLTEITYHKEG